MPIRHAVFIALLAAGVGVAVTRGREKAPPVGPERYQDLRTPSGRD